MILRKCTMLLTQGAVRIQLITSISKEGIPMGGDAFY